MVSGTWRGELATHWKDPDTGVVPGPKTVYLAIHQTLTTIHVRLLTDESASDQVSGGISSDGFAPTIAYTYRNEPDLALGSVRSEIHDGAAVLQGPRAAGRRADLAWQLPAASERGSHPFGGEEAPGEGHHGDDAEQQQHDLRDVEDEERHGIPEVAASFEAQHAKCQPVRQRRVDEPGDQPHSCSRPTTECKRYASRCRDSERVHRRISLMCASAAAQAASSRS